MNSAGGVPKYQQTEKEPFTINLLDDQFSRLNMCSRFKIFILHIHNYTEYNQQ